jgi:hypothetical protein
MDYTIANRTMTTLNKSLVLSTLVALNLSLAGWAADESLLPPRAKEHLPRVSAGTRSGVNLVTADYAGALTKFSGARGRTAAPGEQPNLGAVQDQPLYTGKSPFREMRPEREFQIAPLVQPAKSR